MQPKMHTKLGRTYLEAAMKSKMVMACSGQCFCFSSLRVAGFFLFSLVFLLLPSLVLGSLLSCLLCIFTFRLPTSLSSFFSLPPVQ
jgi:hypothetical protein